MESTPLTISPPHHHPPNNPRNPTLSPRHPFAARLPIISNRPLPRPHPSPSNPHQSALKPSPGMFSLLLTALPTTIGVAQGVSAAKKEKESQDSDDLLRKFTLRCSIDDDELQRCPEAERWRGGGVVLRDGKVRQYANISRMREGASALPFLQHNTAPNPPRTISSTSTPPPPPPPNPPPTPSPAS